jgi:sec-independent protein translocase protein TatB
MFDVGFWELVVIAVVALLVVGPEKLPALARAAGQWLARGQRVVQGFRADVERELALDEMRAMKRRIALPDLKGALEGLAAGTEGAEGAPEAPAPPIRLSGPVAGDAAAGAPNAASPVVVGVVADAGSAPSPPPAPNP